MVIYNKLNIENLEAIRDKAKTKENGVYKFRGIHYRVRKNAVTHYACNGEVLENYGNFHVCIGTYNTREDALKMLKGI